IVTGFLSAAAAVPQPIANDNTAAAVTKPRSAKGLTELRLMVHSLSWSLDWSAPKANVELAMRAIANPAGRAASTTGRPDCFGREEVMTPGMGPRRPASVGLRSSRGLCPKAGRGHAVGEG